SQSPSSSPMDHRTEAVPPVEESGCDRRFSPPARSHTPGSRGPGRQNRPYSPPGRIRPHTTPFPLQQAGSPPTTGSRRPNAHPSPEHTAADAPTAIAGSSTNPAPRLVQTTRIHPPPRSESRKQPRDDRLPIHPANLAKLPNHPELSQNRSEERRVGKEA